MAQNFDSYFVPWSYNMFEILCVTLHRNKIRLILMILEMTPSLNTCNDDSSSWRLWNHQCDHGYEVIHISTQSIYTTELDWNSMIYTLSDQKKQISHIHLLRSYFIMMDEQITPNTSPSVWDALLNDWKP